MIKVTFLSTQVKQIKRLFGLGLGWMANSRSLFHFGLLAHIIRPLFVFGSTFCQAQVQVRVPRPNSPQCPDPKVLTKTENPQNPILWTLV